MLAEVALVFEGVQIVKVLGRLHQCDLVVVEVPKGVAKQVGVHHVVRVDDRHQIGVQLAQRMVDVASLGVLMGRAGEISRA